MVREALAFLLVGALWGCTNALLKKYSTGNGLWKDVLNGEWRVVALFLLNQAGSVVNMAVLSSQNLLKQPLCNALTCLFTAITAIWIGERYTSLTTVLLGCLCILVGTAVVLYEPAS